MDEKIKSAVAVWRDGRHEGASAVTKRLLEFWFKEDHFLKDGSQSHFCRRQQEAIEATANPSSPLFLPATVLPTTAANPSVPAKIPSLKPKPATSTIVKAPTRS